MHVITILNNACHGTHHKYIILSSPGATKRANRAESTLLSCVDIGVAGSGLAEVSDLNPGCTHKGHLIWGNVEEVRQAGTTCPWMSDEPLLFRNSDRVCHPVAKTGPGPSLSNISTDEGRVCHCRCEEKMISGFLWEVSIDR